MFQASQSELWVLQFDSIHHVLAAEQMLIRETIWHDLVPTPRDIHSDCGMVIQFRRADWKAVDRLRLKMPHKPRGVYRPAEHGHERISE